MPNPNGDVQIRELRRCVQQMFMGFATLINDPAHRSSARELVHDAVLELDLIVRGDQGEIVRDVSGAILSGLDEVMEFSLEPPEDA
jgi:hypothetical protein